MKILCAIAFSAVAALGTATVHAAPEPVTVFATWHMADLQDVTQAWYFTGEALSGQYRDGVPWAVDRPLVQHADTVPVTASFAITGAPVTPVVPTAPTMPTMATMAAAPIVPARVDVPPTIPEPRMAPMLLVGLLLIFLRISRREEHFG